MKKIMMVLFFFSTISIFSQEGSFTDLENFSFNTTVKSLNTATSEELKSYIDRGIWVVLDGSLSSITKLSGKDEDYLIETSLVQGEWQELEKVVKYTCRAIFQGNQWMNIIPDRVPRNPTEEMILLNSHVLVLGQLVSYEQVDGKFIPYLLVSQIRKIP